MQQYREKGEMMDKRTARKVHGADFRATIKQLNSKLLLDSNKENNESGSRNNDAAASEEPETNNNVVDDEYASRFKVFIRKRPLLSHEPKKNEYDVLTCVNQQKIVVQDCQMHPDMRQKFILSHEHTFSKCFDETSDTSEVYNDTTKPLVSHALNGGQAIVMMYGQTGSGKTHTMNGIQSLLASDLFNNDSLEYVQVSALEIAGNKCFDLFSKPKTAVNVLENKAGDTILQNANTKEATSAESLLSLLKVAANRRVVKATAVNSVSSRAHCLCQLLIKTRESQTVGKLTLADLAGSERNADSMNHDEARHKETIEINKSHMALKLCLRAKMVLDSNNNSADEVPSTRVPYRESILTRVLKDSLWSTDGQAAIIATVSPTPTDTEHTLGTLQYANMMQGNDSKGEPALKTMVVPIKVPTGKKVSKFVSTPIREWKAEMVKEWLTLLKKGAYAKYAKNLQSTMDGKAFVRLGKPRFKQLCDGNEIDCTVVYNALRALQTKQSNNK